MSIQGTNGNGNQFADRFASGDVISASQLNDLINGLSTGLVQPYVGDGTAISFGSGGTVVTNIPDVPEETQPEQFCVRVFGDNLKVAKGRIITQDVWEGTFMDATTFEVSIYGVWAYPAGKKTSGSSINSPWMDSDGSVLLERSEEDGGGSYGVYIVRQPMNKSGQKRSPEVVVIRDGLYADDAYGKTTPWGEANTTDSIRLYSVSSSLPISIDGVPAGDLIVGVAPNPVQYNYNCQRVKVASIYWDNATSSWIVTQHLIGTITLPNVIQYYGTVIDNGSSPGPTSTWPQYSSQCDDWNGTWAGYDKSTLPTSGVICPIGFPT